MSPDTYFLFVFPHCHFSSRKLLSCIALIPKLCTLTWFSLIVGIKYSAVLSFRFLYGLTPVNFLFCMPAFASSLKVQLFCQCCCNCWWQCKWHMSQLRQCEHFIGCQTCTSYKDLSDLKRWLSSHYRRIKRIRIVYVQTFSWKIMVVDLILPLVKYLKRFYPINFLTACELSEVCPHKMTSLGYGGVRYPTAIQFVVPVDCFVTLICFTCNLHSSINWHKGPN